MDIEVVLSKEQKKIFTDSYYPYLCMITYESGETKLKMVSSLSKANYLQETAKSGMTEMLSVNVFAKLPE